MSDTSAFHLAKGPAAFYIDNSFVDKENFQKLVDVAPKQIIGDQNIGDLKNNYKYNMLSVGKPAIENWALHILVTPSKLFTWFKSVLPREGMNEKEPRTGSISTPHQPEVWGQVHHIEPLLSWRGNVLSLTE